MCGLQINSSAHFTFIQNLLEILSHVVYICSRYELHTVDVHCSSLPFWFPEKESLMNFSASGVTERQFCDYWAKFCNRRFWRKNGSNPCGVYH